MSPEQLGSGFRWCSEEKEGRLLGVARRRIAGISCCPAAGIIRLFTADWWSLICSCSVGGTPTLSSVCTIYLLETDKQTIYRRHRFRSLCAEKVQQVQVSGFYHTGGFLSGWCCRGEVTNKYVPRIVRVDGQFFSWGTCLWHLVLCDLKHFRVNKTLLYAASLLMSFWTFFYSKVFEACILTPSKTKYFSQTRDVRLR